MLWGMCCLLSAAFNHLIFLLLLLGSTLELKPSFEALDEAHEEKYHQGKDEASDYNTELYDD